LKKVAVKEMPNLTGVIAMPRLITGLDAFQAAMAARRSGSARSAPVLEQRVQDVVLHLHLVVRDVVAFADAVEVGLAHVQRVLAQGARDVAQDGLDHDHALRPAEAAEGGVALGVGLAAVRRDLHVRQEVGVVGVEDRAVGHRPGQVGAEAAVGRHHQLQAGEAAVSSKPPASRRRTGGACR
jgi:hypothetical protein